MENEVEISNDFIFLGIYLVTLYLNLEGINEKLDVHKAYQASLIA